MLGDIGKALFGDPSAGSKQMKEANAITRDNIAKLEAIGIPTIEAQRIALETPQVVDMLVAEQMQGSAFEDVQADPRLRGESLAVMDALKQLSGEGLGPEDRAALAQIQRQVAGQAQAQQASILQDMAQRGTMDSGAQLAAQLQGSQGAADRMNQQAMMTAANAAQARRQALGQTADLASMIEGRDLGLQSQRASAMDSINQFNTQNRTQANMTNLQNRQNVADRGVDIRNQQEMANKSLLQQQFQNQMTKATGQTQASNALAQGLQAQAQAAQQGAQARTAAMGQLIGTGIQGYGAYQSGLRADNQLAFDKDKLAFEKEKNKIP